MDCKDFAFTLIIPGGCIKKCIHKDVRYRDLHDVAQKVFLQEIMDDNILPDTKYTCAFEQHKDGRFHMHGTIFDISRECMWDLQRKINLHLGYSSASNKIFHFKEEYYQLGWKAYCNKDILLHCDLP